MQNLWPSHDSLKVHRPTVGLSSQGSLLHACVHGHQGVSVRTLAQILAAFL